MMGNGNKERDMEGAIISTKEIYFKDSFGTT